MPLTSLAMRQSISNFRLNCCSKKFRCCEKKMLLEQLQVCIFAEIVVGVRCTLIYSLLLVAIVIVCSSFINVLYSYIILTILDFIIFIA